MNQLQPTTTKLQQIIKIKTDENITGVIRLIAEKKQKNTNRSKQIILNKKKKKKSI